MLTDSNSEFTAFNQFSNYFLRSAAVNNAYFSGQLVFPRSSTKYFSKSNLQEVSQDFFLSYRTNNLFSESVSDLCTQLVRTNVYNKKSFHHSPIWSLTPENHETFLNISGLKEVPGINIKTDKHWKESMQVLIAFNPNLTSRLENTKLSFLIKNEQTFYNDLLAYSYTFKK